MRTLRLIWVFLRLSALNEFQYRANLVMQLFNSVLDLSIGLAGLALVFYHTESLAGWLPEELLVVVGVHVLTGGLLRTVIQPSMGKLMEDIGEGTLDYTLTKPEDAQLLVSLGRMELWRSVDVLLGIGVIVYASWQLGQNVGLLETALFSLALISGSLLIYAFWLGLTTSAFWVVRMWAVFEFFESLYQAGRWPVGIYPDWLRIGLTFLVPVAFAVTVPSEALTDRLTPNTLVLAIVLAFGAMLLSRLFWRIGLRRYSGASA